MTSVYGRFMAHVLRVCVCPEDPKNVIFTRLSVQVLLLSSYNCRIGHVIVSQRQEELITYSKPHFFLLCL